MPQTNKVNYNTSRTNRIEEVYTDIINAQGADDKMEIIIETLSETVIIPDIGRKFTPSYTMQKLQKLSMTNFRSLYVLMFKSGDFVDITSTGGIKEL